MIFFFYTFVLLAIGCALALRAGREASNCLGEPLVVERPHRRLRVVGAAGLLIAAVLVFVFSRDVAPEAVLTLSMGVLLLALAPSMDDRVAGTEGVLAGWDALRFEDLDEWRLTGEHLRFKLRGMWTAVPLPEALQLPVRRRLEELVPERESAFRH